MRLPGFTAEASFGTARAAHATLLPPYLEGEAVVPALPLGGWSCVAAGTACSRGNQQACDLVPYVCKPSPEGGYPECTVTQGNCTTWTCYHCATPKEPNKMCCECLVYGPSIVTCDAGTSYGGW